MFTIDSETNAILLTKGNTAYFDLVITDPSDDSTYSILATDIITMSVKKHKDSLVEIFTKTASATGRFTILPEDTIPLVAGTSYVYDIKLVQINGDITTVVPWSPFIVDWRITE